LLEHQDVLQ